MTQDSTVSCPLSPLEHPEVRVLQRGHEETLCLWARSLGPAGESEGVLTSAGGHSLFTGNPRLPQTHEEACGFLDNFSRADGPLQGLCAESGVCTLDAHGNILTVWVYYRDPELLTRFLEQRRAAMRRTFHQALQAIPAHQREASRLTHLRPALEAVLAQAAQHIFPQARAAEVRESGSVTLHTPSGEVDGQALTPEDQATLRGLAAALLALGMQPGEQVSCEEPGA